MSFIVYRYRNRVNDKSYIGVSGNISLRKQAHARGTDQTSLLYLAMKKYGEESFDFEILIESTSRDLALDEECRFIGKFNSFRNGYNRTKGGDGLYGLTGENAPGVKITKEVAQYIINDPCPLKEAATKYGVTVSNISLLRRGSIWKELDRSNAPNYGKQRRLTKSIVRDIIMNPCSNRDAALKYDTSDAQIHSIRANKTWKSIDRSNAPKYHQPRRK